MTFEAVFAPGTQFVDLFAGIGGFHKALSNLGATCVYASEWDQAARETYQANYAQWPEGDITQIQASDIPSHQILCAGFPCQAFSVSGKKQGFADTRGTLFFDVARIVSTHHPEAVFLENVKNFARHDNGNTLETVKKTLEELGYNVYSQVLNASHYGIPTSRERIYIVALREDIQSTFTFPKPSHIPVQLQDYLLLDHLTDPFVIEREDMVFKEEPPKPDESGFYPAKPIRIGTIGRGGQGERIYSPQGHAITFSAYGGGVASCTGAYLVNGRVRKLSPRECARVMGFGDDFIFPASPRWAWRQFGNSVAVGVVEAVAGQIALVLNGGQTPPVDGEG